ncbi:MAG: CoA ester lyase [Pseudomonadota bacterium]
MRPRRSVLYLPGANGRAIDKSATLDCDSIIFDLEDAVAPAAKDTARLQVAAALATIDFGFRERVVRINGLDTPWAEADIAALADAPPDALLLPKLDTIEQIATLDRLLAFSGLADLPRWFMVETPRAVLELETLVAAGAERLAVLVMGTSDLVKELRAEHQPDRANLSFALQRALLVARAAGKEILDGVQLDFRDLDSFATSCAESRAMGFDGRTLIHPTQVEIANRSYGPSAATIEHARRVLDAWDAALVAGAGVVELDGQLVENLHADEARRVLAQAAALAARTAAAS